MKNVCFIWLLGGALALGVAACTPMESQFVVTIENISDQSDTPTPFSPGIFVVHDSEFALFREGEADEGLGLEQLAEDGNPALLIDNISFAPGVAMVGTFLVPEGGDQPAVLEPGVGNYQFQITANNDAQYLSLATMFVQSNDLFFAPNDSGIRLFRFSRPISGDITRRIRLWDLRTEVNEKPGEGANQAPRQLGPNSGLSETGDIVPLNDEFSYPSVSKLIRVTIEPQ